MLRISKVEVYRGVRQQCINLYWEAAADTSIIPEQYSFTVLRSGSVGGPFDIVGGPFYNRNVFSDPSVDLRKEANHYFYKIRVTHTPTSDTWETDPIEYGIDAPLIALEVRRLEAAALWDGQIGRKAWLFPIKTYGERCPECFNSVMGKRVKGNCKSCYNSTFVGGFHAPILISANIPPTPTTISPSAVSVTSTVVTRGRMDSFPPVKYGDIIVEKEGRRWRVTQSVPTEHLRYPVHQELDLVLVLPSDVEYDLPVREEDVVQLEVTNTKFSHPKHTLDPNEVLDALSRYYR